MLFTQLGARPSTAITWGPHGSRAFAPYPQHHIPSENAGLVRHNPFLSSILEIVPACEYAEPCPHLPVTIHATHEAGQRRMMRAGKEHASPDPTLTRHFASIIAAGTATPATFAFSPLPLPDMGLTFLPRPQPRPRKRSRAAADIDGEHSCMQKKKRRLRLFLITSRLSPQFSHPATNIVDRGSSKIAVWAKQRSLGRNLLRKAAILNHIRRGAVHARIVGGGYGQVLVEQEKEQKELAMAKLEFEYGSVDTYTRPVSSRNPSVPPAVAVRSGGRFVVSGSPTGSPTSSRSPSPTPPSPPPAANPNERVPDYHSPNEAYAYTLPPAQIPRRDYIPLPPSPLGLSNYDAFDTDENVPNPYSHLDDDDEDPTMHLFDDDDEDEDTDSVPFSPSAVTSTSSSTVQTRVSQIIQTPTPFAQPNLDVLDHGEPVLGDYDQVEDGAGTVWPSVTLSETTAPTIGSTSPDFNALFATAPSKRADSFATSPNFKPAMLAKSTPRHQPTFTSTSPNVAAVSPNFTPTSFPSSASPNFVPSSIPTSSSPNFAPTCLSTSTSPNFSASSTPSLLKPPTFTAPNTSPNLAATAMSPNLLALDAPNIASNTTTQRRLSMSMPNNPGLDERARRNSDVEQGRKRKR